MPDVISDTSGKLCVGSYHMWRLLSSPDNYSLLPVTVQNDFVTVSPLPLVAYLAENFKTANRNCLPTRELLLLKRGEF